MCPQCSNASFDNHYLTFDDITEDTAPDVCRRFKCLAYIQRFAADTYVNLVAAEDIGVFYLRSGRAVEYLDNDVIALPAVRGAVYGIIESLAGCRCRTRLFTITECDVGIISQADLIEFLTAEPQFCLTLAKRLARSFEHSVMGLRAYF